jgi:hypothetical protein
MGRSYFAFLVRSQSDLKAVRALETAHNTLANDIKENDNVGEAFEPEMEYLLYFQGEYFLILGNLGGGTLSTQWLSKNKPPEMVIIYPFDKPDGWDECRNFYDGEKMKELLQKLPEKSPGTASKFKIREPPINTPHDQIYNFLISKGINVQRNVKLGGNKKV